MEKTKTTKYFGIVEPKYDINAYGDHEAYFYGVYKEQTIFIVIEDYEKYGDKLAVIWELIDKYVEIMEIAKKAIIENFPVKEGIVHEFFKVHFKDDFYYAKDDGYYKKYLVKKYNVTVLENIDIASFIEKMDYPSLYFDFEEETIRLILDYYIFKTYSDTDVKLCVFLNEDLQVTDFEIDRGG